MSLKQQLMTPFAPRIDKGESIPKLIYQTYPSKQIPKEIQENIEKIKALNPSYKYHLFDDHDVEMFIKEAYEDAIWSYYDRINPKYGAARADLFRYLLIYRCGGVYLDIKSTILKPLDDVLNKRDEYLLAKWENPNWSHKELTAIPGGEFQNWHIIAVQGHPFLKAVIDSVLINIDSYRPWLHGVGKPAVIRITGPVAYTLAIQPILNMHPKRIEHSDADLSLKYSIFSDRTHRRLFAPHYSSIGDILIKPPIAHEHI